MLIGVIRFGPISQFRTCPGAMCARQSTEKRSSTDQNVLPLHRYQRQAHTAEYADEEVE